jgi:hypothetical protein
LVVTVIVALPDFTAVTLPPEETVATDVLLLVQVTSLFVALLGETVAVRVSEAPSCKVRDVLFNETPVTDTVAGVTVTEHFAVLPPSLVVTVIVALPDFTAVTLPPEETVATEVLLLVQLTSLFVALLGDTVAVRVSDAPSCKVKDVLFNETPVTETDTETEHCAVFPPSLVVTVIVALPDFTAVTLPSEETVATEVLLLVQLTSLFVALLGDTVAVSVSDDPSCSVREDLFNETLVTDTVVVKLFISPFPVPISVFA